MIRIDRSVTGTLFLLFSLAFEAQTSFGKNRISEALQFCRQNNLDTVHALFVDMSLHPGRYRIFMVDLQRNKPFASALCCHGMGGGSSETRAVFSNRPNSNCTSLGKYRTGARAYSRYGIHIHYKLHGLENSNNNALKRTVVLHSFSPVPSEEIYPNVLPLGWSLGCPVTSDRMMRSIDSLMLMKKKSLLLWIYQ